MSEECYIIFGVLTFVRTFCLLQILSKLLPQTLCTATLKCRTSDFFPPLAVCIAPQGTMRANLQGGGFLVSSGWVPPRPVFKVSSAIWAYVQVLRGEKGQRVSVCVYIQTYVCIYM